MTSKNQATTSPFIKRKPPLARTNIPVRSIGGGSRFFSEQSLSRITEEKECDTVESPQTPIQYNYECHIYPQTKFEEMISRKADEITTVSGDGLFIAVLTLETKKIEAHFVVDSASGSGGNRDIRSTAQFFAVLTNVFQSKSFDYFNCDPCDIIPEIINNINKKLHDSLQLSLCFSIVVKASYSKVIYMQNYGDTGVFSINNEGELNQFFFHVIRRSSFVHKSRTEHSTAKIRMKKILGIEKFHELIEFLNQNRCYNYKPLNSKLITGIEFCESLEIANQKQVFLKLTLRYSVNFEKVINKLKIDHPQLYEDSIEYWQKMDKIIQVLNKIGIYKSLKDNGNRIDSRIEKVVPTFSVWQSHFLIMSTDGFFDNIAGLNYHYDKKDKYKSRTQLKILFMYLLKVSLEDIVQLDPTWISTITEENRRDKMIQLAKFIHLHFLSDYLHKLAERVVKLDDTVIHLVPGTSKVDELKCYFEELMKEKT